MVHPGPARERLPVGGAGAGGSDYSVQELQDLLITPTPGLSSVSLYFLDFSLRVRCERVKYTSVSLICKMGFVISLLRGWKPVCCWHSAAVEIGLLSAGLLVPRESLAIYSRPALVGTGGQKLRDHGPGQRVQSALQPADRAHTRQPLRPAPEKAPGSATSRPVVPPSCPGCLQLCASLAVFLTAAPNPDLRTPALPGGEPEHRGWILYPNSFP